MIHTQIILNFNFGNHDTKIGDLIGWCFSPGGKSLNWDLGNCDTKVDDCEEKCCSCWDTGRIAPLIFSLFIKIWTKTLVIVTQK